MSAIPEFQLNEVIAQDLEHEKNDNPCTFTWFPFSLQKEEFNMQNRNYFSRIPNELVVEIFKFLPLSDLRRCAMVSKEWRTLSFSSILWKKVTLETKVIHVNSLERILNCRVRELYLQKVKVIKKNKRGGIQHSFHSHTFEFLECLSLVNISFKTELLSELIYKAPNLKSIIISKDSGFHISCDLLKHIIINYRFLEKLHLREVTMKNSPEVLSILEKAEVLADFKSFVFWPSEEFFLSDAKREYYQKFTTTFLELCPNLEFIDIYLNCGNQNSNKNNLCCLEKSIFSKTNLKILTLRNVEGHIAPKMVPNCEIVNLAKITLKSLSAENIFLTKAFPSLEYVYLKACSPTFSVLKQVMDLPKLKYLFINDLPKIIAQKIPNCLDFYKNFEKLHLFHCAAEWDPKFLEGILSFSCQVVDLKLTCRVRRIYKQILKLKDLKSVELEIYSETSEEFLSVDELHDLEVYNDLNELQKLKCTDSYNEPTTTSFILKHSPNISNLELNCGMTEEMLICILSMKNLETLVLTNDFEFRRFNAFYVDPRKKLNKLTSLKVVSTRPTEFAFVIKVLILASANIEKLSLFHSNLSQEVRNGITHLRNLSFVRIVDCGEISSSVLYKYCPKLKMKNIDIRSYY